MPYRLTNPAQIEIVIVSKAELEKINRAITNQIKYNRWRNTQTIIDWFKSIPNKTKARFMKFCIVEFYPSIIERLLDNALSYAKTLTTIPKNIIQLIKHEGKSLLLTEENTCIKKREWFIWCYNGSHNGAEVYKSIGIYLLEKLSKVYIEMTGCLLLEMQTDTNLFVWKIFNCYFP